VTVLFAFVRALHFLSLMTLFGGGFFEADLRKTLPGLTLGNRWLPRAAAILALATGLFWLALTAGQMSGDWHKSLDFETTRTVLIATHFGGPFLVRLACLLILCVLCFGNARAAWRALAAGGALVAISLTGHAAASGPPPFGWVGAANDAVHLLSAGFWIGGLALVALLLAQREKRSFVLPALTLFSNRGLIAVALLLVTGIVNALTILLPDKPATPYLLLLCLKIALALGMVALAVFNRMRLMPRIAVGESAGMRISVICELVLGVGIVTLVGFLGLITPLV
jgi:putative copper resistance protein D